MKLDIRGRNIPATPAIEDHIRKRMNFALDRLAHRVRGVVIRISDIRGMIQCCQLQVDVAGVGPVYIEETDRDLYVAIDRAATRAKRSVRRTIKRHLSH